MLLIENQYFPKPGILFKDITPLLADPEAFHAAIRQMMEYYEHKSIDAISAAEARGFLFAAHDAGDPRDDYPQRASF